LAGKQTLIWHRIQGLSSERASKENAVFLISAAGRSFTWVNSKGTVYILSEKCPHQGGPLSQGFINEAGDLVCPWHRYGYNCSTGKAVRPGGECAQTYPLKEEEGSWFVGLPAKKFFLF
jgi:nitrite reductase/ring-hydroxylating ferredoxin subunit